MKHGQLVVLMAVVALPVAACASSKTSGAPAIDVCAVVPASTVANATGLPIGEFDRVPGDLQACSYPYVNAQGIATDVAINLETGSPLRENTQSSLIKAVSSDAASAPLLGGFAGTPVEGLGDIAVWLVPKEHPGGDLHDLVVQVRDRRVSVNGVGLTKTQAIAVANKVIRPLAGSS